MFASLLNICKKRPFLLLFVFDFILGNVLFYNIWLHPLSYIISTDNGDQIGSLWRLTWPVYALTHHIFILHSDYLGYPGGFNVMWTYQLLPGILMAPITLLFNSVLSYNVLTIIGFSLSAWFASIFASKFMHKWSAIITAGLMYGFGPYQLAQSMGHLALTSVCIAPLIGIVLYQILQEQQWPFWKSGILLGFLLSIQFYIFLETFTILIFYCGLTFVTYILYKGVKKINYAYIFRSFEICFLSLVVLCGYAIFYLITGPNHLGGGINGVQPSGVVVGNLTGFIIPSPTQLLAFNHNIILNPHGGIVINSMEWDNYLGIPLLALITVGFFRIKTKTFKFFVLLLGLTILLDLGQDIWLTVSYNTHIPFIAKIFDYIPLMKNILWSRVGFLLDLFSGILLGLYIESEKSRRFSKRYILNTCLFLGIFLTMFPYLPRPTVEIPKTPKFFTTYVEKLPQGIALLIAPYVHDGSNDNPEYWQIESGYHFKMSEGYFFYPGPNGPEGYPMSPLTYKMFLIENGKSSFNFDKSMQDTYLVNLKETKVKGVVIGPMPYRQTMVIFFEKLLAKKPKQIQGVQYWALH